MNSCSDSVLYLICSQKGTENHECFVILNPQWMEMNHLFFSVWQEMANLYWHTTWNDRKCTTEQVDNNFCLEIHQVSLIGILKVYGVAVFTNNILVLCSIPVVFLCNICEWTTCLRPLIQCTIRCEPKKRTISMSCVCGLLFVHQKIKKKWRPYLV